MKKIQVFLFFAFFLRFDFGIFGKEGLLFAQEGEQGGNLELSRQYNENGAKLFSEGKFCEAAQEFENAIRTFLKPEAIFNAALAWEKCGEIEKALSFYQEYLKTAPDNEREQIAAKIEELKNKIAERIKIDTDNEREEDSRKELAARIETEEPKIPPLPYRTWKWVGTGGAVLFLSVALGFNADAVSRAKEMNRRSLRTRNDWDRYHSDFNNARREQITAYVFYGLAGAGAVASAILWYLDSRDSSHQENPPTVSFAPVPGEMFSVSF